MPATHPPDDLLNAYLLGRLDDADAESVELHLEKCADCLNRAAGEAPTDTLVVLLAAARTRLDTVRFAPADLSTPAGSSLTHPFVEPLPASALAPPPELANHPKYRVIRPLGVGGMGTVWLAEHLVMGRQVAVKVVRAEWASRPAAAERFRREVRAAGRLTHPNITAAFDAEQVGERLLLVMEYVPGESLAEVVRRGPLPTDEACRAVRDAARGLAAAHAAGLVHRDVKPGNLIRTPDGVTKVLDFGLATAEPGEGGLTGVNLVMGTPDYIAPEQAENPRAADTRSDIYALGCTLYHLLSGRVPYPAETPLKKIDAHRDPAVVPPSLALPAGLSAVLRAMTATRPGDRLQTAAGVADALEPFTSPEVGARRSESRARPFIPPSASRLPGWVIAAGLLVAAVSIAAGVVAYRGHADTGGPAVATPGEGAGLTPVEPVVVLPHRVFAGHTKVAHHALFGPDGKRVYSCGQDGFVRVWDVDTGEETAKYDHHRPVYRMALAEGGKTLLSVSAPRDEDDPPRLFAWDTATGKDLGEFPDLPPGDGGLTGLAVSPDGRLAATLSAPGELRVWDVATRRLDRSLTVSPWPYVYDLAWSPDGEVVAVCGDCVLAVWETSTWKPLFSENLEWRDTTAVFSPDGRTLYVASRNGRTRVYDRANWTAGRELKSGVTFNRPTTLTYMTGGRLLLGAHSPDVRVWDIAGDHLTARLQGDGLASWLTSVSPDSRWVTCGSEDGKIRVWKLPDDLLADPLRK